MNEATHGVDVDAEVEKQAINIGATFLTELRYMAQQPLILLASLI
jgi:hypothetical protein